MDSHCLVLPVDAIRPFIVLVAAGKTLPFDQHVLLPVDGAAFLCHSSDECRIVGLGRRAESPSPDSTTVPTEKTCLERRVIGVDNVFESGVRIYLLLCECLDDGDEAVVRGALDSHDVHNLTIVPIVLNNRRIRANGDGLWICKLKGFDGEKSAMATSLSFHVIVLEEGRFIIITCTSQ